MPDSTTDRAIGRLEGKMEEVLRLLKESSEGRARLYEGQEKVGREVHDLSNRMGAVEKTVSIMDPLVQDFARLKQRGLGILAVLGVVWLILGGLILQGITWLGSVIWRAVGGGP